MPRKTMFRLMFSFILCLSCVANGAKIQHPIVNIAGVFEKDSAVLIDAFHSAVDEFNNSTNKIHLRGHTVIAQGDAYQSIKNTCFLLDNQSFHIFLTFANTTTIHNLNMVATVIGMPVIGYITDNVDQHVQIHHNLYMQLKPSTSHLARGLARMMLVNFWYNFTLIIEDTLLLDGFYAVLQTETQDQKWDINVIRFSLFRNSSKYIENVLAAQRTNSSRIFVLHASVALVTRIFKQARKLGLGEHEFAWIITENAYSMESDVIQCYVPGTLVFLMNRALCLDDLVKDSVLLIGTAAEEHRHVIKSVYKHSNTCWPKKSTRRMRGVDMYRAILDTHIYGKTGPLQFDTDGYLSMTNFKVKNLVFDGRSNVWREIGCIQGDNIRPFKMIWPGDATDIRSSTQGKKRYRVVTNPVQPFVMIERPHSDYDTCMTDTVCLNITSKNKSQTIDAIDDYERGINNESYKIYCCRGLSIDLLNRLASDLDFEFTLYIVQDETYGQKKNGTWDGMMWDLMEGTAHFAVAAFSITRARTKAIDFTDPYFFSGFSILYSERTRETNMDAFLEPFSLDVWFAIFVSGTLTAIAMALFEWNSPFGLNPWGRKRKANYTLASGLTMVYSVLFGHTVKTKSPKAWPSKVMQNFWAFASIFIIASYTANLAAFIAGKHAGIHYIDINDQRLLSIRVGCLPGSAVEQFLKKVQNRLADSSSRWKVKKTDIGIRMVIEGKLDAYLGDYPILDYARAHLAPNCELKMLSQVFGDDRYGIGIPKGSPLKVALSRKIMRYHQSGYIDDLTDVHFADAQCFKQRITQEDSQLEVQHHAGLFVMLCVGILVGVLVCLIEYAVYAWVVPKARSATGQTKWKSSHVMFFSQRLHRCITSAELLSAKDSAKEMLDIIRNREFARLFQKSTIRKNKLADMAKTKRLNRNFYDIVEKAKWLQEMKDNNLMDDSTDIDPPTIIGIPLKDLGMHVERAASIQDVDRVSHDDGEESHSQECLLGGDKKDSAADRFLGSNDDHSDSSSDSLLGGDRSPTHEPVTFMLDYPNSATSLQSPGLSGGVRFWDSFPNGDLVGLHDEQSPPNPTHTQNNHVKESLVDDTHNLTSSHCSKTVVPKTNFMVRSVLHKTQSYQDHLCSEDDSHAGGCLKKMTKEELLAMWKTSEIRLNRQLNQALKEKATLERKLAQLQRHSPV